MKLGERVSWIEEKEKWDNINDIPVSYELTLNGIVIGVENNTVLVWDWETIQVLSLKETKWKNLKQPSTPDIPPITLTNSSD